jgi:hypothetical protein
MKNDLFFNVHVMELICAETSKGISFSRGYRRDHKVGKQGKSAYFKYFYTFYLLLLSLKITVQ